MWKKVILLLTIVIAVILGIMNVYPSKVGVSEFSEKAQVRLSASDQVPFYRPFMIKGLALSGSWEGPGFAQVWLISGEKKFLVMDTRNLPEVLELADFGSKFEKVCMQTCNIEPVTPEKLFVLISGPGFLTIDQYHFAIPLSPSGLASCPNCKKVPALDTPNHATLLMILLLVIAVIGAHALDHMTQNPRAKKLLIVLFVVSFITLTSVFGVSVAAPTAPFAVATKKAASFLAAIGVIVLFAILAVEMRAPKPAAPKPNVWKDLEEAEEEWKKK